MSTVFEPPLEISFPNSAFERYQGVGMTSQRTRNRLIQRLKQMGISSEHVLEVMRVVPRHIFLDEAMASRAYEDTALPIGFGQTISQPWVVAKMTEWLFAEQHYKPIKTVLEIGTGSGYQTAILALLAERVFTVERIAVLSKRAQEVLRQLCLSNIEFKVSDGYWGWPHALGEAVAIQNEFFHTKEPPVSPLFDGIISAASPKYLPEELLNQLKIGGRLVMPIGNEKQGLYGFIKTEDGIKKEYLGDVLFVPMKQGIEH